MVGLIVITHCQIAQELVKAAELILGKIPACVPIGIAADEKLEKIAERLEAALAAGGPGRGSADPHRPVRGHAQQRQLEFPPG